MCGTWARMSFMRGGRWSSTRPSVPCARTSSAHVRLSLLKAGVPEGLAPGGDVGPAAQQRSALALGHPPPTRRTPSDCRGLRSGIRCGRSIRCTLLWPSSGPAPSRTAPPGRRSGRPRFPVVFPAQHPGPPPSRHAPRDEPKQFWGRFADARRERGGVGRGVIAPSGTAPGEKGRYGRSASGSHGGAEQPSREIHPTRSGTRWWDTPTCPGPPTSSIPHQRRADGERDGAGLESVAAGLLGVAVGEVESCGLSSKTRCWRSCGLRCRSRRARARSREGG